MHAYHFPENKLIHPLSMTSEVIPNTRLEKRTMSQEMMYELRKGQEALKEELNLLKSQMGCVLETLQALLRKEDHHVPIILAEGTISLNPYSVTPSQWKFSVATPHLPAYSPPSRCHLQPLTTKSSHQRPLAIPP